MLMTGDPVPKYRLGEGKIVVPCRMKFNDTFRNRDGDHVQTRVMSIEDVDAHLRRLVEFQSCRSSS